MCMGKLFTFCGLDGCGKTTMIRKLHAWLVDHGYDVELTKQPTNAVRQSDIFRNYMDTDCHDAYDYRSLSLLAASDRLQHSNRVIKPLLEQGKIVLSDRYFYSCIANLHARGYVEDQWIYEVAKCVPIPDAAFFLDVDVMTAVERVRMRPDERNSYIDMELQYKLRNEYIQLSNSKNAILIQNDKGVEIGFREILKYVKELLPQEGGDI